MTPIFCQGLNVSGRFAESLLEHGWFFNIYPISFLSRQFMPWVGAKKRLLTPLIIL
jgi:hypothetical protein